jgi:hypothetical protein
MNLVTATRNLLHCKKQIFNLFLIIIKSNFQYRKDVT